MLKTGIVLFFLLYCSAASSEAVDSLLSLSEKYQNINLDSAVSYALKAKEVANKSKSRLAEADAIDKLARAFALKGDIVYFKELSNHALYLCEKYDLDEKRIDILFNISYLYRDLFLTSDAINNIQLATEEIIRLPKNIQRKFYPEMYSALGYLLYFELKDSIVSLEYLHKAQNAYLDQHDTVAAGRLYLNMGEIFRMNGQSDKAANYYEKARQSTSEHENSDLLGVYYRLRSALYLDKENMATALQYLRKSESVFLALNNNKQLSDIYSMFAYAYSLINEDRQSLEYNIKSLSYREILGNKSLTSSSLINIANSYLRLQMIDSALFYSDSAYKLSKKIGHKFYISKSLLQLSNIYKAKKQYEPALDYLKEYTLVQDTLELEKGDVYSILENKIKYSQIEKEFEKAIEDNELIKRIQTLQIGITIVSTICILLLFYLFITKYRHSKKLSQSNKR
jgi:tetratricopeptide (TPR) repeat protein